MILAYVVYGSIIVCCVRWHIISSKCHKSHKIMVRPSPMMPTTIMRSYVDHNFFTKAGALALKDLTSLQRRVAKTQHCHLPNLIFFGMPIKKYATVMRRVEVYHPFSPALLVKLPRHVFSIHSNQDLTARIVCLSEENRMIFQETQDSMEMRE